MVNKNRSIILFVVIILLLTGLFTACSQKETETKQVNETDNMKQIYYINRDETKIVGEKFNPVGTTSEELVKEYVGALDKEPKDSSLIQAKPETVKIEKYTFNQDGRLSLYFNSAYSTELVDISEVLCRAAIVKTLSQIEGVESIEFYVDGQPLMDYNGKAIGLMTPKDFIDSTSAEDVFVKVYFSNPKGTKLMPSNLKITYDGNFSIEQLIVERLIQGPIEDKMIKTLPEGTVLNKISTKDGICYVDFNSKFLDTLPGINDEVVIYSIVNSLVELSTIHKVQFSINGDIKKNFGDGIAFDGFFERNLELVEGSK